MPPTSSEPRDGQSTAARSPALAALEVETFVLTVAAGPDAGSTFAVDRRVLVGQSPACDFKLTDPHVSRRHVALDPMGPRLRVTDLESTNGTFVNDVAIADAFLAGGERLRLGDTTLRVDRGEPSTLALTPATGFGHVVGESSEMRRLYPLCRKLAASDVPVVIEGETGTGKEVLAESLHEEGSRAEGPFVVFDCTATPANLLEAALFGHERGSFTGAVDSRKGVFEQAHGGTLFIDEIGDLDLALQSKLLRALERREIRRIGGDRWIKVDVRVLAATRRDLDREVAAGRFRDDLFFRLAVARIELPPLRRRQGDIAALTRHFWQALSGRGEVPADLLARFEAYTWPGNIRELHNTVARQLALGELADLKTTQPKEDSAASVGPPADAVDQILALDLPFIQARDRMLEEFEHRYVERALAKHGGNVTHAAAACGVARRYFQTIRSRSKPKE
jgi:two-component system, NtrC family, response regulator HydG